MWVTGWGDRRGHARASDRPTSNLSAMLVFVVMHNRGIRMISPGACGLSSDSTSKSPSMRLHRSTWRSPTAIRRRWVKAKPATQPCSVLPRSTLGSPRRPIQIEVLGGPECLLRPLTEGSIDLSHGRADPLKGPTDLGTARAADEEVALSSLIDKLKERFGTDITEADQLFFDQIRASAETDEKIVEVAKANNLPTSHPIWTGCSQGAAKYFSCIDPNLPKSGPRRRTW